MSHSLVDIRRQGLAMFAGNGRHQQQQMEDLYSSSEYVRHTETAAGQPENMLACCNHRSLETLHLAAALSAAGCSSPVPSRISCPPHNSRQQQHSFAFIVDPLKGGAVGRGTHQQSQQQSSTGMRNRTKSLDNGLKFSLGTRHRKHRVAEGELGGRGGGGDTLLEAPVIPSHSRLDQAKQFLRRFYASSTLRLASKRRRKEAADPTTSPVPDGALNFSTAMGPFFELRRPCAEELPLLPYNIHYAVDGATSSTGSQSEDDSDTESATDAAGPSAAVINGPSSAGSSCPCPSSSNQRWPAAAITDDQSAPINSSGGNSRTLTPTPCSACFSAGTPSHQSVRTSAASSDGRELALLANDSTLKRKPISDSPDSALGASPGAGEGSPSSQMATTPSAGYGSLSSSDSSEAKNCRRRQNTTTTTTDAAGHNINPLGSAERRFANWNELFQYLRREIVDMNVRDALILRNLETIQADLNGVRQMQQQRRSRMGR